MPSIKKADTEKLNDMLNDFNKLFDRLSDVCADGRSGDYTDLYNLAIKIINHVVKSKEIRRRFAEMGGKVLTLESERLRAEGRAEGGNLMIYTLVQNGEITPETGAKQLKITVEELKNKMLLTGFSFPET